MNDAEYEAQKARVRRLIDPWIEMLGLKWWHIRIEYERGLLPAQDESGREVIGKIEPETLARCAARWQYLHATILVSLELAANHEDDADLEWTLIHECCHILLNEARQMDQDDWLKHEERLASQFASAFQWVRDITRDKAIGVQPE